MATKAEKEQMMFSMIEEWKGSGQNQHEFCKTKGLAYSGFHYWYKKFREGQAQGAASPFVPVHIRKGTGSPLAELILPDGKRLSFYQAVDAAFLRTLLS